MAMSQREKQLFMITISVAAIFIASMGWRYLSDSMSSTNVSANTINRFEDLFITIQDVDVQKGKNRKIKERLGNPNGEFIGVDEITQFLAEIDNVGKQSGVKVKNFDPDIDTKKKPLQQLTLKLSLEGRFDKLITFLQNLKKAKYFNQPIAIKTSLKSKDKPELDIAMTLVTYLMDSKPKPKSPGRIIVKGE
jgi:Tfp pilus assembly protein PilO